MSFNHFLFPLFLTKYNIHQSFPISTFFDEIEKSINISTFFDEIEKSINHFLFPLFFDEIPRKDARMDPSNGKTSTLRALRVGEDVCVTTHLKQSFTIHITHHSVITCVLGHLETLQTTRPKIPKQSLLQNYTTHLLRTRIGNKTNEKAQQPKQFEVALFVGDLQGSNSGKECLLFYFKQHCFAISIVQLPKDLLTHHERVWELWPLTKFKQATQGGVAQWLRARKLSVDGLLLDNFETQTLAIACYPQKHSVKIN